MTKHTKDALTKKEKYPSGKQEFGNVNKQLNWPNTQHSGHMGQNIQNWKNNRNKSSQANWGMW